MTYTWHDVDGRLAEICDECGFDARGIAGEAEETGRLLAAYAGLERLLEHPDADRRPAPETWSAREYVDHCLDVCGRLVGDVVAALGRPEPGAPADLGACRELVATVWPPMTEEQRATLVVDVRRGYAAIAPAELPEVSFRG